MLLSLLILLDKLVQAFFIIRGFLKTIERRTSNNSGNILTMKLSRYYTERRAKRTMFVAFQVFVVKSAIPNAERRASIRQTWGYERRFSDVAVRTVFLLGSSSSHSATEMAAVERESIQHGDIVQGDFIDTYYNNTIKTMMGLRWAAEMCPTSRFYMFVDDDYYVSTRNLLRFVRNPLNYPRYLEEPVLSLDDQADSRNHGRSLKQLIDFDLPEDAKLFAGHVMHPAPLRHKPSKWYVSLEEYPYHLWPPYVTAGAYILSRPALSDLYYASYFVKRFRFDDIFLGLVAKKVDLELLDSEEFHFERPKYTVASYRYVVASHGFGDPAELRKVWIQQKEAGNA